MLSTKAKMASNHVSDRPSTVGISEAFTTYGETYINVSEINCTWVIHNFTACEREIGKNLVSPTFFVGTSDEYKWRILLYPNGTSEENKDYLSVYLILNMLNKDNTVAKFAFSIVNAENEKIGTLVSHCYQKFKKDKKVWGYDKFVKRDCLLDARNGLLPDDNLTIHCKVYVVNDTCNMAGRSNTMLLNVQQCRPLDDFSAMYESKLFYDVILIARSRGLKAHKVILAARSRVFLEMFKHNRAGQKPCWINIADMADEVLAAMLQFIYTGKVTNLDKMADGLLAAANRYELEILKVLCEEALIKSLTIENAASRLILGNLHGADNLKEQAMEFTSTHLEEVMNTADYRSMHFTHPRLIDEATLTFIRRKAANSGASQTPSGPAGRGPQQPSVQSIQGRKRKNFS